MHQPLHTYIGFLAPVAEPLNGSKQLVLTH